MNPFPNSWSTDLATASGIVIIVRCFHERILHGTEQHEQRNAASKGQKKRRLTAPFFLPLAPYPPQLLLQLYYPPLQHLIPPLEQPDTLVLLKLKLLIPRFRLRRRGRLPVPHLADEASCEGHGVGRWGMVLQDRGKGQGFVVLLICSRSRISRIREDIDSTMSN
jgi:hypothetical protein